MDGALTWAPVHDMQLSNVLDIGTGTGAWAVDFAEAHPESRVFGTDLRRIRPAASVPPNWGHHRISSSLLRAAKPFQYTTVLSSLTHTIR